MKCEEMQELLESFADKQADPKEQKTVLAHLEACADCRKTMRWLSVTKSAMRGVPLPELPADLKANLLREARRLDAARAPGWGERLRDLWRVRPWAVGLAFAGAAAAVVLIARVSADRGDVIPLDAMLAAHNEYERTMPLSSQEQLLSELPSRMAEGGAENEM